MPTVLASALDKIDADLIRAGVTYMVALILSITVHEFGHAKAADILGDRLPRSQGRVTLNPVSHIDPWGTIVFPLLMFISAAKGVPLRLLGWGKPVLVSGALRRYRWNLSHRVAHFIIAAAGPMMNIAFGLVLSGLFVVAARTGWADGRVAEVLASFVLMNIGLAMFNLLPCPPLDGGALLTSILGESHPIAQFLNRYGFIIFIVLLMTGALSIIMRPASVAALAWLRALLVLAG